MRQLLMITALLAMAQHAHARQSTRYVYDEQGKPLPFVTIGILNQNRGTYSFEDGSYQLDVSTLKPNDIIQFTSIGFESLRIGVQQLTEKTVLKTKIYTLPQLIVRPTGKKTYGIEKKNSASDISISKPYRGAEVAVLLALPEDSLRIEAVHLNIKAQNLKAYTLRVRFYEFVAQNAPPGEMMKGYELQSAFDLKKGTITFAPQAEMVVAGPVFISFEWLVSQAIADQIKVGLGQEPEAITALKVAFPEHTVNVYNQNRVEVKSPEGEIVKKEKLKPQVRKELKQLQGSIPILKFQTTKAARPTYYRSHSLGTWYRYQQSLIASIDTF